MIPPVRFPRALAVFAACFLLGAGITLAQEPAPSPPPKAAPKEAGEPLHGVLWDVHVFEGSLAASHGMGSWIREVHVPELGVSFNLAGGTLHVFAEGGARYGVGEPEKFVELPGDPADPEGPRIRVPVVGFGKNEPPRRVRDVQVPAELVRALRDFVDAQARVQAGAAPLLR